MRLRDNLQHANFVAASMAMDDQTILGCADLARTMQMTLQGNRPQSLDPQYDQITDDNLPDWRDHILALMLLRDCLGREMTRRGLTPPGPPMLARDWESGGIYLMSSVVVPMPEWLTEMGRNQLAQGAVGAYPTGKGVSR